MAQKENKRPLEGRTVFRMNDYDNLVTCMGCGWAIGWDLMEEDVEPLVYCPGCGKVIDEVDITPPPSNKSDLIV